MINLKELRKKFNVYQKDIAKFLKVTQGNISDIETGRVEPDIYKIIKLAEFFGITTDELLAREPISRPSLTQEQEKLLRDYDSLNESEKHALQMILHGIIESKVKDKV